MYSAMEVWASVGFRVYGGMIACNLTSRALDSIRRLEEVFWVNERCQYNSEICSDRYYARGLCQTHYYRARDGVNMRAPLRNKNLGLECHFDGCILDAYSMGRCHTHDMQMRSNGEMWPIGSRERKGFKNVKGQPLGSVPVDQCREEDCDDDSRNGGRCSFHHQRKMQGLIPPDPSDLPCPILECQGIAGSYGICYKHKSACTRFGLTVDEITELFNSTRMFCPICREKMQFGGDRNREAHIDHDHACCPTGGRSCGGCVRGVICRSCNMALGHVRDSVATLDAMKSYLLSSIHEPISDVVQLVE